MPPRLTTLAFVPYQWRSQWRDLRQRGAWRGANVAMVVMLGLAGLGVEFLLTLLATVSLARGRTDLGVALGELGLTAVLVGWISLPVLVSSVAGGGAGVTVRRLAQFPLSPLQLFAVGALGSLLQPAYWVLILASLMALVPLALMPQPAVGVLAGVVYLLAAAVISWALGLAASAVASSRRGREIALTAIAIVFFGSIPLYFGDFGHAEGEITYTLMGRRHLLIDAAGERGLLLAGRDWMPGALVSGAARGEGAALRLAILAAALAAGLGLSVLSLRRLLAHPAESLGGARSRRSAIRGLPGLPPPLGVAAVKELRYLLRTLDALLGFAFGAIAAVWIVIRPDHGPLALMLCFPATVLNEMVMPLNAFGLDGPAVDRYRLLPLTGRQILGSKNLAFLLLVLLEALPAVLAGFWRLGATFTLAALCAGLAAVVLMMAWGNQTSVRSPAPRAFFNFDSKEQGGGILSMLGVTLLWLLPFGVGLAARGAGRGALLLAEFVLLLAAAGILALTLPAAGRAFEARAQEMRDRLAGQE